MKSDIQIAQEAVMEPITEVATRLDIREDELELYGKYKAKFSDELLERVKRRTGWKTGTCYRDQSDSGRRGKDDNQRRLRTGIWKTWKKSSHCAAGAISRTMFWY